MERENTSARKEQEAKPFLFFSRRLLENRFADYHAFYETDSKAQTALAVLKSEETRQVRRIWSSVGMFAIFAFWGIPLWTGYHWWEYLLDILF